MVIKRQKIYTSLSRKLSAKAQRGVLNAFERGLKTKVGGKVLPGVVDKTIKINKKIKPVKKTVNSLLNTNAGYGARRVASGTLISPGMTAAAIADPVLAATVPAFNAVPANFKMLAAAVPVKTPAPVQKIGKQMIRKEGRTAASRIGNFIENGVNTITPVLNRL